MILSGQWIVKAVIFVLWLAVQLVGYREGRGEDWHIGTVVYWLLGGTVIFSVQVGCTFCSHIVFMYFVWI